MFNLNTRSLDTVHRYILKEKKLIKNIELINDMNFNTVVIKSTKCGR